MTTALYSKHGEKQAVLIMSLNSLFEITRIHFINDAYKILESPGSKPSFLNVQAMGSKFFSNFLRATLHSENRWDELREQELNGEYSGLILTISQIFDTSNLNGGYEVLLETMTPQVKTELNIPEGLDKQIFFMVENSPVAMAISRNGIRLCLNLAYREMFGFNDSDELIGQPTIEQIAPQHRNEILKNSLWPNMGLTSARVYETNAIRKDGTQFHAHITVTPVEMTDGTAWISIFTDMTARDKTIIELEKKNILLDDTLNVPGIGYWQYDAESRKLYLKGDLRQLFGTSPEAFTERTGDYLHLVHPEDREWLASRLREFREQTLAFSEKSTKAKIVYDQVRMRFLLTDGSEYTSLGNVVFTYDPLGDQIQVFGSLVDLNSHSIEVLKKSNLDHEEKFHSFVKQIPAGISIMDKHGTIIAWNDMCEKIIGIPQEDAIGKKLKDIQHRITFVNTGQARNLLRKLENWDENDNFEPYNKILETSIIRADGEERLLQVEIFPSPTPDGFQMVSLIKDITDQKRMETDLEEKEGRYWALFNNNHAIMLLVDPQTSEIVDANPSAVNYYGWTKEELVHMKISEINTLPEDAIYQEMQLAYKQRRQYFLLKHRKKDGQIRHVEVYSGPIQVGSKSLLYSIVHDIHDRIQAEKNLQASRAELETTIRQLRSLSNHLQKVREEERTAIAREVHDELGQRLTGIKFEIYLLKKLLAKPDTIPNDEAVQEKFSSILQETDNTIDRIRYIAAGLRPSILDTLGLIPAIDWLTTDFEKRTRVKCSNKIGLKQTDFSADFNNAIFRICQEALTNITRHANASQVEVLFYLKKGHIHLEIQDNGVGISAVENSRATSSMGIAGMKERAKIFRGTIIFENCLPSGTRVSAIFPKSAALP